MAKKYMYVTVTRPILFLGPYPNVFGQVKVFYSIITEF